MSFHIVTVPIERTAETFEALNAFLARRRVLSVDRQLIHDGTRSAWTFCVTWVPLDGDAEGDGADDAAKKGRVDYREVLDEQDFAVFAKLRDLRKRTSEREGVPPYALFTNEQLAEMVRRKVATVADLGRIHGVGPARVERYGAAFVEVLRAAVLTGAPATRRGTTRRAAAVDTARTGSTVAAPGTRTRGTYARRTATRTTPRTATTTWVFVLLERRRGAGWPAPDQTPAASDRPVIGEIHRRSSVEVAAADARSNPRRGVAFPRGGAR